MQERIDVHKVFAEYFTGSEALAYAISAKQGQGNICLDLDTYLEGENPGDDNPFFESEESFEKQTLEGEFVTHKEDVLKPFVVRGKKAYLQRYYQYESQIIQNIETLGCRLKIITGGPGTGKTYSVSTALVSLFRDNPNLKVALAAPTGKAAARMNEAIRDFAGKQKDSIPEHIIPLLNALKAQTIHLLLGPLPDSVFFRYNAEHKLPYDVLIIDECSMIDGAQMAKLLNAVNTEARIFLLGDKDQLASVEAGSVFGDICRMADSSLLKGKVETKLESRRFDKDKGIGRLSREVINGALSYGDYVGDEQVIIDKEFDSRLFREFALKYMDYIHEPDVAKALKLLNRIRFLCATREHDHSVAETNIAIEKLLKKAIGDTSVFNPVKGFYHNQPIIITQNDYNLKIHNGDVALIRKYNDKLFAFFESSEGEPRKIQAAYLNHYDTVFAMTIHKSQGSEFDHVVVLLPEKRGRALLTRELLYTGITRAENRVLIQSTEEVLLHCVKNEVARSSGLMQRIK